MAHSGSQTCKVDQYSGLPAHKPLAVEIEVADLKQVTRVLAKPANFADMFEEKLKEDLEALEQEVQEGTLTKGHAMLDKKGRPNENNVRRRNTREFQRLLDQQIEVRKHRLELAVHQKDTTRQWDLTAAAFEAAAIEFHGLTGTDAKRMRGRSKVRFLQQTSDPLDLGKIDKEDNDEISTKANRLKNSANSHSMLGNKLNSMAKRMHANERNRGNKELHDENICINVNTIKLYRQGVEAATTKLNITEKSRRSRLERT